MSKFINKVGGGDSELDRVIMTLLTKYVVSVQGYMVLSIIATIRQ